MPDLKETSSTTEEELDTSKKPLQLSESVDKIDCFASKKKRRKKKPSLPIEIKDNPKLHKYWKKRYSLFSKFDLGIKLDEGNNTAVNIHLDIKLCVSCFRKLVFRNTRTSSEKYC